MAHSGPFETSPISRPATNPDPLDELPPHSIEAERAALGCVLWERISKEAMDELLHQLQTSYFYDPRHQTLFVELVQMRMDNLYVEPVTLLNWLKGRNKMYEVGGDMYLLSLPECSEGFANFPHYLAILKEKYLRRQCLNLGTHVRQLAQSEELTPEQLKEAFSDLVTRTEKISKKEPEITIWSLEDIKKYRPDPKSFLVGAGMICRAELTVLCGDAGVGKTRLANTLALAGARGTGTWMGYEVKRRWRTLILQTENSADRIYSEFKDVPSELSDFFRISLPCIMQFGNPSFRQELRRLFDRWLFDMVIIDNMNDVAGKDDREAYSEALINIRNSLPGYPNTPATLMVAHPRKQGRTDSWAPKSGTELMHEVSGSLVLTAKARTVFSMQRASREQEDPRIIFQTSKCNNDVALPRSAWLRANGVFTPIPNFDWDEFDNPPDPKDRGLSALKMEGIFAKHGPHIGKDDLREILKAPPFNVNDKTAYRYVNPLDPDNKFKDRISMTDTGRLAWK